MFDAGKSNGVDFRNTVNEAGAAKEFEVVEALVIRDFARFWRGNWIGKEQAAAIAGVADACGNAGGPDERRGFKGVGEEDGAIKTQFLELLSEPPFGGDIFGAARDGIRDDVVDQRFVIEAGDQGRARRVMRASG